MILGDVWTGGGAILWKMFEYRSVSKPQASRLASFCGGWEHSRAHTACMHDSDGADRHDRVRAPEGGRVMDGEEQDSGWKDGWWLI